MLFLRSDYHIRCYEHEASFHYFNSIADNFDETIVVSLCIHISGFDVEKMKKK